MTSTSLVPRRTLPTLLAVSTLTVMAGATLAPALPELAKTFDPEGDDAVWIRLILTLPALFTVLGAPVAGWLTDRLGRRPVLLAGIVLYTIGGALPAVPGWVETLPTLLACRALLGLAVGAILTTAVTLVADYYEGAERERILGFQGAFMGYGGVVFLSAGGILADQSWRAPFLVYLLAALVLPLVLAYLPEPSRDDPSTAGTSEEIPLTRGDLVRLLASLVAVGFLGMVLFYLIPVQVPFVMTGFEGISNTATGLAIACFTLVAGTFGLFYGRFRQHLSVQALFALGFAGVALGYLGVAFADSYWTVLGALLLTSLGFGQLVTNVNVWANQRAPRAIRGRVNGAVSLSFFLGQFASPILAAPVIETLDRGLPGAFLAGAALAAVLALGFLLRSGR